MQGLIPILGGLTAFLLVLLTAAALIPLALAYVALRVRDTRHDDPDPNLGAKTAFHLIHSLGILMALGGLTISAIDLLNGTIAPKVVPPPPPFQRGQPAPAPKEDGFNTAQRTAVALIGVGAIFALAFWGFLLGTNDRSQRNVKRVFVGGRMALCLLITMAAVAGLVVTLVQKDPNHEITESLLAILLVWLPAAGVHMYLFQHAVRESVTRRSRDPDDEAWSPRG